MAKIPDDATLAVDSKMAARLAGPALPFGGPAVGPTCLALEPPAGATPVPAAIGTVLWHLNDALRLTVVMKASFAISPGAPLEPSEPDALRTADVHHKNQPLAHITSASDRVPVKPAVDVTLLGHAYAPAGAPAAEMKARFALVQKGAAAIDKSVRVLGERAGRDDAPRPFTRMPIVYERAFGGLGAPVNPIGIGAGDDEQPNILDPANPWAPAGFGPIASAWPLRHKRLGDVPQRNVDAPVIELPAGFGFAYFQSAPQDQQIPELDPTATIVLEGLHPTSPRMEISLPGARGVGAVYGLDDADPDAPAPLAFRADGLHVDADRWIATVTFRAIVALRERAQVGRLLVAAGVGLGERLPSVPARRPSSEAPAASAPAAPMAAPVAPSPTGTLELSGGVEPISLPFGAAGATMPIDAAPAATTLAPSLATTPAPAPVTLGQLLAPIAAPPPSNASAAPFFHDISKLRGTDGVVPRAKDPPRPTEPAPHEVVDLERYAKLSAIFAEPDAQPKKTLAQEKIERDVWRQAALHWRRALERESRNAEHALRDRYDDAYVAAWEELHPDGFGPPEYAQLRAAEQRGRLQAGVDAIGLDKAMTMRLRRVWRRRLSASEALRAKVVEALLGSG